MPKVADHLVATVRAPVMLSLSTDLENFTLCKPSPRHEAEMHTLLDQLVAWGGALRTVRVPASFRGG